MKSLKTVQSSVAYSQFLIVLASYKNRILLSALNVLELTRGLKSLLKCEPRTRDYT